MPSPWPRRHQDPSCPLTEEQGLGSGMWPRAWSPLRFRSQEANLRVAEPVNAHGWLGSWILGVAGLRQVLVTPSCPGSWLQGAL